MQDVHFNLNLTIVLLDGKSLAQIRYAYGHPEFISGSMVEEPQMLKKFQHDSTNHFLSPLSEAVYGQIWKYETMREECDGQCDTREGLSRFHRINDDGVPLFPFPLLLIRAFPCIARALNRGGALRHEPFPTFHYHRVSDQKPACPSFLSRS